MAKPAKAKSYTTQIAKSLGELALDPVVACVLDELGRLEKIRNEVYDSYLLGNMVAAEQYKKYNQRFTDTYSKFLLALRDRGQSDKKQSGLTSRQKFLVGMPDEKEEG